jgi:hypothetical protein
MSGTTSKPTKAATLARVQALIAGTQKHFPSGSFTLGNVPFTTTSLVQLLQSLADAIAAVNTAQAGAKAAVAAMRATHTNVNPVIAEFTKWLRATFGTATSTLAEFGLEPPKARTPMTAEAKTAAVAKRAATRAARGTTSKKQKLAVKGNVTGIIVTPVISPAPASPAEQPAATPSPAQPATTATSSGTPAAPAAAPGTK